MSARPTWDELAERAAAGRAIARIHKSEPLGLMHGRHGPGPDGRTCGQCVHRGKANLDTAANGYPKCDLYGSTRGPGTDWRAGWPACGAFAPLPPPPWTEKRAMGDRWWRYYRGDELLGAVRYLSRYGQRLPTGTAGFDVGYVDYVRVWVLKLPGQEPVVCDSLKIAEEALADRVAELDRESMGSMGLEQAETR